MSLHTKQDYERVSHTHCWDNDKLPCGIPLEKHTQCCLCDLPVPTHTKQECCEKCKTWPSIDLCKDCKCHQQKCGNPLYPCMDAKAANKMMNELHDEINHSTRAELIEEIVGKYIEKFLPSSVIADSPKDKELAEMTYKMIVHFHTDFLRTALLRISDASYEEGRKVGFTEAQTDSFTAK